MIKYLPVSAYIQGYRGCTSVSERDTNIPGIAHNSDGKRIMAWAIPGMFAPNLKYTLVSVNSRQEVTTIRPKGNAKQAKRIDDLT
jgi:hypothetical protein